MIRLLKSIGQITFFIIVSYVMNLVVSILHIKIPGSILGMILVFLLLQLNIIKLKWVELGANLLLAELLLFFIPSAAGIIQYSNLLFTDGLRILLVVLLSSLTVMACTGLAAQAISRRKEHKPL